MNRSLLFFVFGVLTGLGSLLYISTIPFTPIQYGIIETRSNPSMPMGTQLTLFGYRIHHYVIGIALIITGAVMFTNKHLRPVSMFLFGFGSFLIIDQLPNLLSGVWDRPVTFS